METHHVPNYANQLIMCVVCREGRGHERGCTLTATLDVTPPVGKEHCVVVCMCVKQLYHLWIVCVRITL